MKYPLIEDSSKREFLIRLVKSSFKKGYAYVKKFCR